MALVRGSHARLLQTIQTNPSPSRFRSPSLSSALAIITGLFAYIQLSLASQFEGVEQSTETKLRFDYPDVDPMTNLGGRLTRDCGIVGANFTNTSFLLKATPQCTWAGNPEGPAVNISVEEGKNLTSAFISCMDSIMREFCSIYGKQHHPEDSTPAVNIWIPIGICIGMVVIFVPVIILFSLSKGGNVSSSSSTDTSTPSINTTSYTSDTTSPAPSADQSGVSWTMH